MKTIRFLLCGLAIGLAGCEQGAESTVAPPPPGAETPAVDAGASATTVDKDVQLVSLKVENMMCPVSCYPAVKETLAGQAGVEDVELAPQKEEGLIDNPVVLVKTEAGFDADKAIAALKAKGYNGQVID